MVLTSRNIRLLDAAGAGAAFLSTAFVAACKQKRSRWKSHLVRRADENLPFLKRTLDCLGKFCKMAINLMHRRNERFYSCGNRRLSRTFLLNEMQIRPGSSPAPYGKVNAPESNRAAPVRLSAPNLYISLALAAELLRLREMVAITPRSWDLFQIVPRWHGTDKFPHRFHVSIPGRTL